jgi:hypothetical protein
MSLRGFEFQQVILRLSAFRLTLGLAFAKLLSINSGAFSLLEGSLFFAHQGQVILLITFVIDPNQENKTFDYHSLCLSDFEMKTR